MREQKIKKAMVIFLPLALPRVRYTGIYFLANRIESIIEGFIG